MAADCAGHKGKIEDIFMCVFVSVRSLLISAVEMWRYKFAIGYNVSVRLVECFLDLVCW